MIQTHVVAITRQQAQCLLTPMLLLCTQQRCRHMLLLLRKWHMLLITMLLLVLQAFNQRAWDFRIHRLLQLVSQAVLLYKPICSYRWWLRCILGCS